MDTNIDQSVSESMADEMPQPQNTGIHPVGKVAPEIENMMSILMSVTTDGNEVFVSDEEEYNKQAGKRVRDAFLELGKLCKQHRAEIQQRTNGDWWVE